MQASLEAAVKLRKSIATTERDVETTVQAMADPKVHKKQVPDFDRSPPALGPLFSALTSRGRCSLPGQPELRSLTSSQLAERGTKLQ